jgi:arylsulfatase A-like enzyme
VTGADEAIIKLPKESRGDGREVPEFRAPACPAGRKETQMKHVPRTRIAHRSLALVVLAAAVAGPPAATTARAADRRPNFLFVYTDDQRWDAMGVVQREQGDRARFPWFQTPHMDRLANEGVRFRNAFVTLSLCAPSRAAFLTGRYNHLNGIANNGTPFPESNVTHATLLRAAGYTTGYIGKWHMDGQRGQRPGFDYSASFIGQGKYVDCPFEINGTTTPTTGWVDDISTDYAVEFMKKNREKPFSLVVGFKSCHGPRHPPKRAEERFAGQKARPVPNLGTTAIYREKANDAKDPTRRANQRDENDINYFRCISAADDNLGRLLQTLDELGLADDTLVVFAGDNGYYLGEHGLGDKRSAYEESLRIPLLARYPKRFPKGRTCDQMVLNIDLAPTYLELAGIQAPREMQGRSWVPLLTGSPADWRKSFLAEYFQESGFPGTPTLVAVRTETAKLVRYPGHEEWTELFDLAKDPYETRNLARDPAHQDLLRQMSEEYDRQVKATGFVVPSFAERPAPAARKKKAAAE